MKRFNIRLFKSRVHAFSLFEFSVLRSNYGPSISGDSEELSIGTKECLVSTEPNTDKSVSDLIPPWTRWLKIIPRPLCYTTVTKTDASLCASTERQTGGPMNRKELRTTQEKEKYPTHFSQARTSSPRGESTSATHTPILVPFLVTIHQI